jgi:hypothetical protein
LNDTAEELLSPYRCVDRHDRVWVMVGWVLIQALMWTVLIEMALVVAKNRTSVLLVVDEHPVGALGLALRTNRSANAFARGVRGGILTTSTPWAANTASKDLVNLASRSRIRNRYFAARSSSP